MKREKYMASDYSIGGKEEKLNSNLRQGRKE